MSGLQDCRGKTVFARILDRSFLFVALSIFLLPLIWLLFEGVSGSSDKWGLVFYRPFYLALRNSFFVFGCQVLLVAPLATVLGSVIALYRYPLKWVSLVGLCLPLAMPIFVLSIGIQSLGSLFSFANNHYVDGFYGSLWATSLYSLPIATMGVVLAIKRMSQDERETMVLMKGEFGFFKRALLRYFSTGLGFSLLAGLLTLSDFGVSQIMGFHGVAGNIQIAFAARNDWELACMKCVVLCVILLPLVVFSLKMIYPSFRKEKSEAQRTIEPKEQGALLGGIIGAIMFIVSISGIGAAFFGLLRPLWRSHSERYLRASYDLFLDSLDSTLIYALGAGILATVIGFVIVSGVQRWRIASRWLIVISAVAMSVPSCFYAIGVKGVSSEFGEALKLFVDSPFIVILTQGIRLIGAAIFLFLGLYKLMSQSLTETMDLSGVTPLKRKFRYELRYLFPMVIVSSLMLAVLSMADVGTIILVHPPGEQSFGVHLFTTMDNTPEVVVASVCAMYVLIPLLFSFLASCLFVMIRRFTPHILRYD